MPPYETMHGRKFRTPSCWLEARKKHFAGLELVHQTVEKLKVIRERMLASQSRQKSYADKKRRPITFVVGGQVLLKVSPWKGLVRFRKRGKLSPHVIGPFKVFYPRKYSGEEVDMLPLSELRIDEDRRLVEEPEAIINCKKKKLRHKMIELVLVQWKHMTGPNLTWEAKSEMKIHYPHLFAAA
ncbi:hypothetical protein Lser_V15G05417 [Lactuca serriola]